MPLMLPQKSRYATVLIDYFVYAMPPRSIMPRYACFTF